MNVYNSGNIVIVGVGDLKIAGTPKLLKTTLGSCLGVVLYDSVQKIAGMLHFMLPNCNNRKDRLSKYADTGIPLLLDLMVNHAKSKKNALTAKIFGGARMFNVNSELFDIGKANIAEAQKILSHLNIRIVASRVGGTKGYQITVNTETGIVHSRLFGKQTEEY